MTNLRAYIVLDLGFGDAGKGHLTDYIARQHQAGVIVRYNGGAQAGHNVVTPQGHHHTFSQFGSGMFIPDVKTFLSRHVVIHPGALLVEGEVLRQKGVSDVFTRLRVSDKALVITPFHQATNHIRELMRADTRHGSCGVGVGEAIEDHLLNPDESILAGDLGDSSTLRQKLDFIRDIKLSAVLQLCGDRIHEEAIAYEMQVFKNANITKNWINSLVPIKYHDLVTSDELLSDWLKETGAVVFEGAQGMLIDAEYGFYPFISWTDCTTSNAMADLEVLAPQAEIQTIGVMRCYSVRHGPGPLPTTDPNLAPLVVDHNQINPWQGSVRYGWLDAPLTCYALQHAGAIDFLAITHLDLLPKLNFWQVCTSYTDPAIQGELDHSGPRTLEQKQYLTNSLLSAKPVYETCAPVEEQVIHRISELTSKPVKYVSNGQTYQDIRISIR